MKTTKLKIGKRSFALAFDLNALEDLQNTITDFDLSKLSDYVRTPGGLLDLIVILAREGEALEGRELDVDRRWFGAHISPSPAKIANIHVVILDCLRAGLSMETEEEDPDAEVDVVLEEIKKKEERDG